MGGPGSGNWWRWQGKKDTVEDSLVVGIKDLRRRLFAGAAGTLTWTWGSGGRSSIDYYVTGSDDWPTVKLHYRWRDKEDVNIPVRLTTTPTQFGRPRFWFICPLIVRGIACNRRAGKPQMELMRKRDIVGKTAAAAHERRVPQAEVPIDRCKEWLSSA